MVRKKVGGRGGMTKDKSNVREAMLDEPETIEV